MKEEISDSTPAKKNNALPIQKRNLRTRPQALLNLFENKKQSRNKGLPENSSSPLRRLYTSNR
jgi:hypothetical protein